MSPGIVRKLVLGVLGVFALLVAAMPSVSAAAHHHRKPHRCHFVRRHHHRVKVCAKKKTSPPAAGQPLPYMGAEPSPSIFGIDTGTYDSSTSNYANDFPTAKGLGARWDRFTAGPATGSGNYTVLDDEVTRAKKEGMGVIISLEGTSSACSQQTSNPGACAPTSASDLSNYQAFMKAIVLRYRNVVDYWESWPEPNHNQTFENDPGAYAALLKAQYAEIQSLNNQDGLHMKLLFGSPMGFSTSPGTGAAVLPWTNSVLSALGGARAFDAAALHPYRFGQYLYGPSDTGYDYVGSLSFPNQNCTPDSGGFCTLTWAGELTAYEQLFINHGYGTTPLWLTEFGWPGGESLGDSVCQTNKTYCPSDDLQARYLVDAYNTLLGLPFVQEALWFNGRDYQPGAASPDPTFFYHFGLVNYDFSQKSAASQFRSIAAAHPSN